MLYCASITDSSVDNAQSTTVVLGIMFLMFVTMGTTCIVCVLQKRRYDTQQAADVAHGEDAGKVAEARADLDMDSYLMKEAQGKEADFQTVNTVEPNSLSWDADGQEAKEHSKRICL